MAADVTADVSERLPLSLPASLDVGALQASLNAVLAASSGASSDSVSVLPEQIHAPDANFILAIYHYLVTQLPPLQAAAEELDAVRAQAARREIEIETLIHDSDRGRAESDQRAEDAEHEASQAMEEKAKLEAELQTARTELEVARLARDSGGNAQTMLEERAVVVEQEKRDLLTVLDRAKEESARLSGT